MSDKKALFFAIAIIECYEYDIKNCKKEFGIDLEKIGICQGYIYKDVLKIIKKKREEKD